MQHHNKHVTVIASVAVVFLILVGIAARVLPNIAPEQPAADTYYGGDELPASSLLLSEREARLIAEDVCIKGGEALGPGSYNDYTRTWWFDANLNAAQPGCNPACVVDEQTRTALINWRCTGLIPPEEDPWGEEPTIPPVLPPDNGQVACTMDAKQCPDGSWVRRVAPDCAFAPCPEQDSASDIAQPPQEIPFAGKLWILMYGQTTDSTPFRPTYPDRFTLMFDSAGHVTIHTDCNSMGGTYTVENNFIAFDALSSTLMYCEETQETEFSTILSYASQYLMLPDGTFILADPTSGTFLKFEAWNSR